jgi:hypothetical protein
MKISVKYPTIIELFKNKAPDTPSTPFPVITSLEIGLDASVYYAEKYKTFCSNVN